jgi:hypothetical protein
MDQALIKVPVMTHNLERIAVSAGISLPTVSTLFFNSIIIYSLKAALYLH